MFILGIIHVLMTSNPTLMYWRGKYFFRWFFKTQISVKFRQLASDVPKKGCPGSFPKYHYKINST